MHVSQDSDNEIISHQSPEIKRYEYILCILADCYTESLFYVRNIGRHFLLGLFYSNMTTQPTSYMSSPLTAQF